jgi:hypothetical protein
MHKRLAVGFATLLLAATLAVGAQPDLWIHVFVQEDGEQGETVRINLPLSVVGDVLPHISVDELQGGNLKIVEEIEAEGIDLRATWEAIRDSEDGQYVSVRSNGENVQISKSDGYLLANVDENGEKVRVRLPLDVVDALFSGAEDELNLLAAVEALGRHAGEDLVTVEEGNSIVRIWIDAEPEGRL